MSRSSKLEITDILPFGKFKGATIELLLLGTIDGKEVGFVPQLKYLNWFNKEVTSYTFSDKVVKILKKETDRENEELYEMQREYKNKHPKKSWINWNNWGNYDDRQLMMSESDYM